MGCFFNIFQMRQSLHAMIIILKPPRDDYNIKGKGP
jgi:hypothetical protein